MNPNTIRKIDYWFGQPICFLLTLFSFSPPKQSKPKKIIFLKFIEQGATVLAYNAIKRATEIVGRENVYFCVFENNRPILDILKIIPEENVFVIREKNIFTFLASCFSVLSKIRREKIDTTIDMEFFSRASAIFSFLSGAKIRVGLHRFTNELPYRGNVMTHRLQYNPYIHTSVFYLLLMEASLHNPNEIPMMKIEQKKFTTEPPKISFSESEINSFKEKFKNIFSGDKKVILLNPNASDLLPLRKWDEKKFIELGKKILNENNNALIVITGAPSEQKSAEEICQTINSPNVFSFAGKTSLEELFILYSLSDILVTNDSGPGHFASITNIHSIVLFGPETPRLFGPLSKNSQVIWKNLACSPCVSAFNHRFSPCNDNVCMKIITVDEVYEKVKKILFEEKTHLQIP